MKGLLVKDFIMFKKHCMTLLPIAILFFCGTISPVIVLPIIFRFGYLKGKIINIIIVSVMAVAVNVISMTDISGETLVSGEFEPQKNTFYSHLQHYY